MNRKVLSLHLEVASSTKRNANTEFIEIKIPKNLNLNVITFAKKKQNS